METKVSARHFVHPQPLAKREPTPQFCPFTTSRPFSPFTFHPSPILHPLQRRHFHFQSLISHSAFRIHNFLITVSRASGNFPG
jgi:hypothetical protein